MVISEKKSTWVLINKKFARNQLDLLSKFQIIFHCGNSMAQVNCDTLFPGRIIEIQIELMIRLGDSQKIRGSLCIDHL